jgi:signal transduction histidine kinase
MSRFLPGSVAGRMTLVLIAGMLLVVVAGIAVGTVTMGAGQASLVDRVATLVAVAEAVPAAARPTVYAGAERAGLSIRDVAGTEAGPAVLPDWFTDRLGERLARELAPLGARVLAIGHTVGTGARERTRVWTSWEPILVRVELSDGTRLHMVAHGRWSPFELMRRLAPILFVIGIGLTGLAVWVARRITRPLGRFAEATVRLGADVTAAAPLDEKGPSEIREVARAFNTMQAQIRRLLEGRTHMLAAVSHDLRTPLTRLRLRTEFVEDDQERAKMLKDLDEMEAMIHAAIAYARSDGGGESPVTVDIGDLLEEIRMEMVEAGHRVRLERPGDVSWEGRLLALKRALRNLVENAVNYGGHAEVRVTMALLDITITVEDGGPGIPDEEVEKVFTPFYRLERSRSRDTGGAGLGLALARAVIREHGGDITLSNRPEGGLRQTVVLPRNQVRTA